MVAGCPSNIKQDAKTGKDGKPSGAKAIKLDDDGEGKAKDIVTYPGGDRIDWKSFTLKKRSDVEVVLKWAPPRPGLDLSMNIFDDTFHVLKKVKPAAGDTERTKKNAELTGLEPGKYYVQVYASARGDAGEYTLEIHAKEIKIAAGQMTPIADPPKLPAVPPPPTAGGPGVPGAPPCPPGTPPDKCPPPPPPCMPGAPAGMPCICTPGMTPPPCPITTPCMPGAPAGTPCICDDKAPPPCKVIVQPKRANITEKALSGQEVIITLDKGSSSGVAKGWTGVILIGSSTKTIVGSEFTIFKVTEDESYGKIRKKSMDEIGDNFRVLLTPPEPK